jgi:hemerythrin
MMEKIKISNGIFYIEIPGADLRILCGCPADSIKHLKKRGLVITKEKGGVAYETGPNAILLSDLTMQNGAFANLAEFPVLHMFYKQGMIIPKHPNNTGKRPMLIGAKDQIIAQSRYIYRGNYGLVSVEEIIAAGVPREEAEEMMRMKLSFSYGSIRKTEELLDFKIVDPGPVEIHPGVTVRRKALNLYEISYAGETVEIDLNLKRNENYTPPYTLGYYRIKPEYFSVIHTGEGDGWDPERPCMGSILTFQGKIYLIDAGPGILDSLTALGISINEVDGIFHTHCHDDHFAGLTSLIRSDHMINYYATPLVRASVIKKLCALMSIGEERFAEFFRVTDLRFGEWNRLGGLLDVMPIFSAHPVETSILYFRTEWSGGYKTYAHLSDIASLSVLKRMLTDDPKKNGISMSAFERFRETMFIPANLKKIDAGKGPIHGDAQDFVDDPSDKIILSHTNEPFSLKEKEIGSTAAFGQTDVLIPSRQDYSMKTAHRILKSYFPGADDSLVRMLLDCPVAEFTPGSIILRKGQPCRNVYLLLTGVAEAVNAEQGISNDLSSGSLIGEVSFLENQELGFTYRAVSPLRALEIPNDQFNSFIHEVRVFDDLKRLFMNRMFLLNTDLFGEMLSFPVQNEIARLMKKTSYAAGTLLNKETVPDLYLIEQGKVELKAESATMEVLGPNDFFGEEGVLLGSPSVFSTLFREDTVLYSIPREILKTIPIVQIKLLETFKKRMSAFSAVFSFKWKKSYRVGIPKIDEQHKTLFKYIENVYTPLLDMNKADDFEERLGTLISFAREHFAEEEELLRRRKYPFAEQQKEEHQRILSRLDLYYNRLCTGRDEAEVDFLEYLKGWIVAHTLLEDRKYGLILGCEAESDTP